MSSLGKTLAMVVALTASARAQEVDASGGIAGTVYDSIAGRPLAGALVQMVAAANPSGTLRSTTSDTSGAFAITGLPPGRYLVEVAHEALDSLALGAPRTLVDIQAGAIARVQFAVPSMSTIYLAVCGARGAADSSGMLLGQIRDARTGRPVREGTVETQWQELVIGPGALSVIPRRQRVRLGAEGWFVLCGVPGGDEIGAMAWSAADSSGMVAITVPIDGLLRRDFFVGGRATVRGSVRTTNGSPIASARVTVAGRDGGVESDSGGAFVLTGIPAGSQTLDIRALGYMPDRRRMDLPHGTDTLVAVALVSVRQVLDTIRVVGERVYDRDVSGFLRRRRAGLGYFLDDKAIAKMNAPDAYQLLSRAPGVWISYQGVRRWLLLRDRGGGYCAPQIVLDGMRMPRDMAQELDVLVRPTYLAGVEIYRGPHAPAEFADMQGCGSVVMWTKPPPPKVPKPDR